ncbi:RNA helicase required for poly(A+) mRNA export, partial [Coemansia pectinata]
MLDQQGLGDQTLKVKNSVPKSCQFVLFSATFPENVQVFTSRFAPEANEIRLKATELTVEGIKQFYMDCKNSNHKFEVLSELYSLMTVGQSIIFVRRRDTAERISQQMTKEGHAIVFLHGQMDGSERDRVMDDFRKGDIKVLITTNVIARGIDIQQVNLVINYDIPLDGNNRPDPETYLHRIGRTGRFGRTGASVNFVHDDQSNDQMEAIQNALGCDIIKVPTDDWEEAHKILKKALKPVMTETSPRASRDARSASSPAVCLTATGEQTGELSRWYFRPLLVVGIRVPTVGFSEEWTAYLGRVSDFLQETLTTAMVTIWATSPLLAILLYTFLMVYFKALRTLLVVYLLFCFFDPRPYDGVGRRISHIHKLPIWAHVNAYFQPKMVFEEPLDPRKKYVFGAHPHGVISY